MTQPLRRPLAALLFLLVPALPAAPLGAVCVHDGAPAAVDAARAQDLDLHASHEAGNPAAPADSCPMGADQAGCTTQAPLPVPSDAVALFQPLYFKLLPAAVGAPPTAEARSIFRPPRR